MTEHQAAIRLTHGLLYGPADVEAPYGWRTVPCRLSIEHGAHGEGTCGSGNPEENVGTWCPGRTHDRPEGPLPAALWDRARCECRPPYDDCTHGPDGPIHPGGNVIRCGLTTDHGVHVATDVHSWCPGVPDIRTVYGLPEPLEIEHGPVWCSNCGVHHAAEPDSVATDKPLCPACRDALGVQQLPCTCPQVSTDSRIVIATGDPRCPRHGNTPDVHTCAYCREGIAHAHGNTILACRSRCPGCTNCPRSEDQDR